MYKKLGSQGLALSCVLLSLGSCGADSKAKQDTDNHETRAEQHEMKSSMLSSDQKIEAVSANIEEISTKNIHGTWGGKLPNYLYDGGMIVELDYLLWRTDCENLNYANQFDIATDASGITTTSTKTQNTDFGFDSGFRIGLGYTFRHQDQWDLMAHYTYFHNTEDDTSSVAPIPTVGFTPLTSASFMQSTYSNQVMGDFLQSAAASWRLNYNVADLELGRNFFIGRQLSIRPHWGLRGAWLYQTQKVNYTGYNMVGGTQAAPLLSGLVSTQINNQNDWHGVGLRSGAELQWGFTKNWALVGSMSAALFYGRFVVRQDIDGVISTAGATTAPYLLKYREGFNAIRPQIDASLGLEWSKFFYHDHFRVGLTAVWEVQEWFEQNVLTQGYSFIDTFPDTATRSVVNNQFNVLEGNLGIQGFTLKLRFDF